MFLNSSSLPEQFLPGRGGGLRRNRWWVRTACRFPRSALIFSFVFLHFLSSALAQQAQPTGKASPLGSRILSILNRADARRAHWGIEVISVRDGERLVGWNQQKFFIPASTAKLFVTATALVRLGPDFTYSTTVEADGPMDQEGRVEGDLVLVGRGDPNLSGRTLPYQQGRGRTQPSTKIFEELADQVLARGIQGVGGDLVVDDTYFVSQPYAQGWAVDDLLWWYGAPVSALAINDNVVFLSVLPGQRAGDPARVRLELLGGYYEIDNHVRTVARGLEGPGGATLSAERRLTVYRRPGSTLVRLWGQIPQNGPRWREPLAIDDPLRFAGEVFRRELARRGVEVSGTLRVRRQEPGELPDLKGAPNPPATVPTTVLASHQSLPLVESLKVINKVSQNLHAEMLLRTLGRERRNVGSVEAGLEEVNEFLKEIGVAEREVELRDGSGLSRQSLVTPAAMVALLRSMYNSDQGPAWFDSLPVAGRDGTLVYRLRSRRVRAKTGNLAGVAGLAGYATNRKNELLAFAIFVNHHNMRGSRANALIDRIVLEIAMSR